MELEDEQEIIRLEIELSFLLISTINLQKNRFYKAAVTSKYSRAKYNNTLVITLINYFCVFVMIFYQYIERN